MKRKEFGLTQKRTAEHTKVVFVGSDGIGKTSYLMRLVEGDFPVDVPSCVDRYYVVYSNESCGKINLELCDTIGDEEYDRYRPLSYFETNIFVLCYSVNNIESWNALKEKFIPEIMKCLDTLTKAKVIFLGLKKDDYVMFSRCQTAVEVEKEVIMTVLEKDYVIGNFQVSSLDGEGVYEVLDQIVKCLSKERKPIKTKEKDKSKKIGDFLSKLLQKNKDPLKSRLKELKIHGKDKNVMRNLKKEISKRKKNNKKGKFSVLCEDIIFYILKDFNLLNFGSSTLFYLNKKYFPYFEERDVMPEDLTLQLFGYFSGNKNEDRKIFQVFYNFHVEHLSLSKCLPKRVSFIKWDYYRGRQFSQSLRISFKEEEWIRCKKLTKNPVEFFMELWRVNK